MHKNDRSVLLLVETKCSFPPITFFGKSGYHSPNAVKKLSN